MEQIKKSNMELEGIYTHLATSGVSDHYYDYQINQFKELTSNINLDEIKIVHIFNSLALARHEKLPFANGVRLGLMMYGFSYNVGKMNFIGKLKRIWKLRFSSVSQTSLTNNLKLKKVLSLHSEVVNIVSVKKGELVGYNFGYVAHNNILVAIVPLGHADGITRNYKRVIINNNYYDIINICMDYIMVKIDNKIKVHDKVDLINDKITIGSIAKNDTPHHILVSISDRVERRYEE